METVPRQEPGADEKNERAEKRPDVIIGKEETVEDAIDRYYREAAAERAALDDGAASVEKAAEDRGTALAEDERAENRRILTEADQAVTEHDTAVAEAAPAEKGKAAVADRLKAIGFEGDPDEFLKNYPKSAENRVLRMEMDHSRRAMLDIENKLKKFEGATGKLRGATLDKWERKALELELEDLQKEYKEMRGEYVGNRAGAMLRERLRIAEDRAAEVAKEKGFGGKVYDAYKKLGDLNLTKLGWEPKGRVGKMVARAVSVRTGISLGLAGAGFALGAGAAAGAAAIMSRRVLAGTGAAFGSYDLMRMVRDRKVGKASGEDMAKMDAAALTEQLEVMEARAMVEGADLSKDKAYMDARAELNRKLRSPEEAEPTLAERERGLDPSTRIDRMLDASDEKLDELKKKRKASNRLLKGVAAGIGLAVGGGAVAKGVRSVKEMIFGGPSDAAEAAGAAAPSEAAAPERPAGASAAEQAAPTKVADAPVERPKAPEVVRPSRVELPESPVEPEADIDDDLGKLSPEAAKILSGDVEAPVTPADVPEAAREAAGAAKEVAKEASERFWTEGEQAVAKGLAEKGLSADQLRELAEGPAIGGKMHAFEVDGRQVNVAGGFEAKRAAQLALERMGERTPGAGAAEVAKDVAEPPPDAAGAAKEVAKEAVEGNYTANEIGRAADLLEKGLTRDQLRELAEGPAIGGKMHAFEVDGRQVNVAGGFEAKRAARFALERLGEEPPSAGGAEAAAGELGERAAEAGAERAGEVAIEGGTVDFRYGPDGSVTGAVTEATYSGRGYEKMLSEGWRATVRQAAERSGMDTGMALTDVESSARNIDISRKALDALTAAGKEGSPEAAFLRERIADDIRLLEREYGDIFGEAGPPADAARDAVVGAAKEAAKETSERFWTEGEQTVAEGLAEKGLSTDQLRELAEGPAIGGKMHTFEVDGRQVNVAGGFEAKRAAQLALERMGERTPGAGAADVAGDVTPEPSPEPVPETGAAEVPEASSVEFSPNERTLGDGWIRNGLSADQLRKIADAPAIRGQRLTFEVDGKPYTVMGGFEAKRAARYALEELAGKGE